MPEEAGYCDTVHPTYYHRFDDAGARRLRSGL